MPEPPASLPNTRTQSLEAARGVAAFLVLFHHFLLAFDLELKRALTNTPLGWTQNGGGAVIFFFTLSGFVLTVRFFEGAPGVDLARNAVKRWPRLWLPAAASILAGAAVLVFRLNAAQAEAARISGSDWLATFGNAHLPPEFSPGFLNALIETVTLWFGALPHYNSSLWTMQWELLGSYLVFGLAALSRYVAAPLLVIAFVMVLLVLALPAPYTIPFVFGSSLAFVLSRSRLRFGAPTGVVLVLFGLLLLSYEGPAGIFAGLAQLALPDGAESIFVVVMQSAGSIVLMLALLRTAALAQRLSGPVARALGELSFPVYLVQVIVICTVSSWTFVALATTGAPLQIPLTLGATLLGTLVVAAPLVSLERWWVPFVNTLARQLFSPAPPSQKSRSSGTP